MNITRRNLCLSLPASIAGSTAAQAAPRSDHASEPTLSKSEVFSLDQLPVTTRPNGAKSWNILHGELATDEAIALHQSLPPAGIAPNPPPTIQHSEFIFVREGTLLFEHDGKSEKVSAGGVIFVALGTKHSARNMGDAPASYLVVAIGGDTR